MFPGLWFQRVALFAVKSGKGLCGYRRALFLW